MKYIDKFRWPLLLTILIADLFLMLWLWEAHDAMRQSKVTTSIGTQMMVFLLLLLWLLFFSGLRRKTKSITLAGIALTVVILLTLFRFREVSGDLMPIFEWRWQKKSFEQIEIATNHRLDQATLNTNYDYPQFLGPHRNAVIKNFRLVTDWDENPPRQLWRQDIGEGWPAFAVAGNLAITQEQRGKNEMVVCYELATGRTLWQHSDTTRYETVLAGIGPRATPTIHGHRVYTLGATGLLNCLDLSNGNVIWQKNIVADNQAQPPPWGISNSPLVLDSLVIVCAGGKRGRSLVAYHKDSGTVVWSDGFDRAAYSSPMLATLAGERQILIFNDKHVVAHAPATGQILWKYPWPAGTEKVAQPVVLPNGRVLVTSGYGVGSKLLKITRGPDGNLSPTLLWESNRLKAKFTNVVFRDGYIYGLDDGILTCIDAAGGKRQWKRGRYGHGQLLLVDEVLLIQAENGDVVLVNAQPDIHQELARFSALEGKTWNNPTLAGPYLLVRNNKEAACYKVKIQE